MYFFFLVKSITRTQIVLIEINPLICHLLWLLFIIVAHLILKKLSGHFFKVSHRVEPRERLRLIVYTDLYEKESTFYSLMA